MSPVYCASCGKKLESGEPVVRIQYGPLYYCKHTGVSGAPAKRDDLFCQECHRSGNVAIREAPAREDLANVIAFIADPANSEKVSQIIKKHCPSTREEAGTPESKLEAEIMRVNEEARKLEAEIEGDEEPTPLTEKERVHLLKELFKNG